MSLLRQPGSPMGVDDIVELLISKEKAQCPFSFAPWEDDVNRAWKFYLKDGSDRRRYIDFVAGQAETVYYNGMEKAIRDMSDTFDRRSPSRLNFIQPSMQPFKEELASYPISNPDIDGLIGNTFVYLKNVYLEGYKQAKKYSQQVRDYKFGHNN